MRYFLELAYEGTGFHGWQMQPNAESVQEALEKALSTIVRYQVNVTGAGRTDTGVHARQMFAHFDLADAIVNPERFLKAVNSLCGRNIHIKDIFKVSDNAHARFDAIERTYKYFISPEKIPFLRNLYWVSPSNLDLTLMNEAACFLIGTQDFTSFAKLHSDAKTNICDVRKALWMPLEKDIQAFNFLGKLGGGSVFTISADRFLRNMVRAVVGTLVDVGRGKLSKEGFRKIIAEKDRCAAGTSMPPYALYLWEVKYPYPLISLC